MDMQLRPALAGAAMLALTGSAAAAQEGFATREALQALDGTYASSAPEKWYGGTGTRRFDFKEGRWSLIFTHALDPKMARQTFRFRTEGPFEIGVASAKVAGAFDAVFYEDVKHVTLLTDDPKIIQAFGFADCGLKLNVEVDISKTGCAGWKPVSQCREDHDLVALDARGLYFGVRPRDNDMCTPDKRPTALLEPVVRQ
jgi:hypothetical protein